MYGRAEHSDTLRRIQHVANNVKEFRYKLQAIRDDLRSDDWQTTTEARDALNEASRALASAEKAIDAAVTALPTPVAYTEPDWQALLRGGGNDVA